MSTPYHQERLETILEEVIEAFPYYTRRKQIEIAIRNVLRRSLFETRT